jgi:HK97 family phage portal protein
MSDKSGGFINRVKSALTAFGTVWSGSGSFWSDGLRTYNFKPNEVNWGYESVNAYKENEIVYQSLRVYLKTVTVPPILLSQVVNEKSFTKYKSFSRSTESDQHRLTALTERTKALKELETHPLLDLLNRPNSYQSRSEFIEAAFGTWKLSGFVVIYGASPDIGINAGKAKELHVLPSPDVTVVYSNDWRNPIKGFEYNVDGKIIQLAPEKVCYIRDWNPENNYEGFSAITAGTRAIKTDNWNKEAEAANYINGGTSYLISNGSEQEDFRYTQEQAKLVDEKIQAKSKGYWNNGNKYSVAGKVEVNKLGDTIVDMNLLEAASYRRAVISQLIGVPGILIGDIKDSKYSNASEAYKALITKTVVPDQLHFLERLSMWLLPPYEKQVKLHMEFDTTVYPELQPDLELLQAVYGRPPLTQNQLLELYHYPALKDPKLGEAILIQSGFETLENLVNTTADTTSIDNQIEDALKYGDYR